MQRAHRLHRRVDFARVLRRGERLVVPEFVLHFARRDEPGPPRVGYSVPRRIGGAVVRNRTRRRLREAVRPLLPRLAASDIVLAARPGIEHMCSADLHLAVADAAHRAGLILSDT